MPQEVNVTNGTELTRSTNRSLETLDREFLPTRFNFEPDSDTYNTETRYGSVVAAGDDATGDLFFVDDSLRQITKTDSSGNVQWYGARSTNGPVRGGIETNGNKIVEATNREVVLYDRDTLAIDYVVSNFNSEDTVHDVAIQDDNTVFVAAGGTYFGYKIDPQGNVTAVIHAQNNIRGVAVNDVDDFAYFGTDNGRIFKYDITNDELTDTFSGPTYALEYDPSTGYLYGGSGGNVQAIDVSTGSQVWNTGSNFSNSVRAVTYNPNGSVVFGGDQNGNVVQIDPSTGSENNAYQSSSSPVYDLEAVRSDDDRVYVARNDGNDTLKREDINSGSVLATEDFTQGDQIYAIDYLNEANNKLVTTTNRGILRIYETPGFALNESPFPYGAEGIRGLEYMPTHDYVVLLTRRGGIVSFDASTGEPVDKFHDEGNTFNQVRNSDGIQYRQMAAPGDGNIYIFTEDDGRIVKYNPGTSTLEADVHFPGRFIRDMKGHTNNNGNIKLYYITNEYFVRMDENLNVDYILNKRHQGNRMRRMDIADTHAYVLNNSGYIKRVRLSDGQTLKTKEISQIGSSYLQVMPGGDEIVVGDGNTLHLLDAEQLTYRSFVDGSDRSPSANYPFVHKASGTLVYRYSGRDYGTEVHDYDSVTGKNRKLFRIVTHGRDNGYMNGKDFDRAHRINEGFAVSGCMFTHSDQRINLLTATETVDEDDL